MTTREFKNQLRNMGLQARKQKGLEVFDIVSNGTAICTVSYADLYPVERAIDILAKKLRPEYIPPLG